MTPGHLDYKTIEERLELFGECPDCKQTNTGENWCKSCNTTRFRKEFPTWTSGNAELDYFIQNTQIHAANCDVVLEWQPWEIFSEIEKIGEGGYGTVFRAKKEMGEIKNWDHKN